METHHSICAIRHAVAYQILFSNVMLFMTDVKINMIYIYIYDIYI